MRTCISENPGAGTIEKYGPGPGLTALGAIEKPTVEPEFYYSSDRSYGDGRAALRELVDHPVFTRDRVHRRS